MKKIDRPGMLINIFFLRQVFKGNIYFRIKVDCLVVAIDATKNVHWKVSSFVLE